MKILAERALRELKESGVVESRELRVKYSGHFKDYNANARYTKDYIQFNLSRQWKNVDDDIQIGLIQSLLARILKLKIKTSDMAMYEAFMKGLSKYAKKHTHDPALEESFNRVNERLFDGLMDKPNLIFASESFRKLGSYEYATDTIHMSTIFQNLPIDELKHLDYVMYHELLHKKHQFDMKNGRHQAHTTAFRKDEKKFSPTAEAELTTWLRKKKFSIKRMFKMW
jgi:predicted metal-dependent hydrolase